MAHKSLPDTVNCSTMREVYLGFRSFFELAGPSGTDIVTYHTEGIKAQAGRFYSLNVESSYLGYFYFYIYIRTRSKSTDLDLVIVN